MGPAKLEKAQKLDVNIISEQDFFSDDQSIIMSGFSNKLLTRNTQKAIRKGKIKRGSVSYDDAENVGILFTVIDRPKHTLIKKFIKLLEKDKKQVDVICLLGEGKENYDFIFDYFTTRDFSFFW